MSRPPPNRRPVSNSFAASGSIERSRSDALLPNLPEEGPNEVEITAAGDEAPTAELPDLSDKLRAYGVYEEYVQYRDKYRQWRMGDGSGAHGELTSIGEPPATLSARGRRASHRRPMASNGALIRWSKSGRPVGDFKYWFPTPQKFQFFYTLSYWVAVLSLQGAFILVFSSGCELFDKQEHYNRRCLDWVSLMVSVLFLLAVYLPYVELINLPDRTNSAIRLFVPYSWSEVWERVEVVSCVGVFANVIAMLCWIEPAIIAVFPDSWQPEDTVKLLFVEIPGFLGGIGFFVGGVCQVIHNRHVESCTEPVVYVALFNTVGGLNFMVSTGAALFFGPSDFSRISLFSGGICYVGVGLALFRMWQANDFGCAILSQLNNACKAGHDIHMGAQEGREGIWIVRTIRESFAQLSASHGASGSSFASELSSPQAPTPSYRDGTETETAGPHKVLSMRGTFFLVLYCWLFAVTYINCVGTAVYWESKVRHITDFVMQLIWMFAVTVVLMVHSAITSAPHVQPYRLALFSTRFILLCATVVQTVIFASSINDLEHFGRDSCD